jgi:hypothetical protein
MVLIVIGILFKVTLSDIVSESVDCFHLNIIIFEEIILLENLMNHESKAFTSHDTTVAEYIECDKIKGFHG